MIQEKDLRKAKLRLSPKPKLLILPVIIHFILINMYACIELQLYFWNVKEKLKESSMTHLDNLLAFFAFLKTFRHLLNPVAYKYIFYPQLIF